MIFINPDSGEYSINFEELYNTYNKKLYITAIMILRNVSDAEDAVQDTLLIAMKNYKDLKNIESFNAWIHKILVNRCYRINTLRLRFFTTSKFKIPEVYNNISEDLIIINQCLLKLSYKYRLVITLRYFNDFSISQISEILLIPEGTIKSQLSRGIKKLKNIIEQMEGI